MAGPDTPLLVVGGRTTGLTMACELARHGVPVRIIDRCEGIDPHCRASVLHSRTLEILRDIGVVEAVVAGGREVLGSSQYVRGKRVEHADFGEVESPFPRSIAFRQPDLEALFEARLRELGVEVERRAELLDILPRHDHVVATIRRGDGSEEKVATPWLLGCDGAHSRVRHSLHDVFPGEADPHRYVIADVFLDPPFEPGRVCSFVTDDGALLLFPLPEDRTLIAADVRPNPADVATPPPTDEATPTQREVRELVETRGPSGLRVRDPRWLAYFHVQYRRAEHYRHGRVFLAGDAAHIHSPLGGHGMNTGIQDAYNLAWKLALVTRRRAGESLLDSYESERRAVAADVLRLTRAATESVIDWMLPSEAERRRMEARVTLPEPARAKEALRREELDLDYRRSPICVDDVSGGAGRGPHAGARAPDAGPLELDGRTTSLHEVLHGAKHTLLIFPGHVDPAAPGTWSKTDALHAALESHGDLMNSFVVLHRGAPPPAGLPAGVRPLRDVQGALNRRWDVHQPTLYLVRPDGYVGYRSSPADPTLLRAHLERAF